MNSIEEINKILEIKRYKKKKAENRKKIIFSIIFSIFLFGLIIATRIVSPRASVNDDHTDVIRLATVLEENNYSVEEAADIVSNEYKHKYKIWIDERRRLVIAVKLINDDCQVISIVEF